MVREVRVGWRVALALLAAAVPVGADAVQEDSGEDIEEGYIGIKGNFLHNTYNDLELTSRGFGANAIGLTFADATTKAQDANHVVRLTQNVLLAELHGYPFGNRRLDLFGGVGYAFSDMDNDVPNTKGYTDGFAWSAGISCIPLQIGVVSFELQARYTQGNQDGNDASFGAGAGIGEIHEYDWISFEGSALVGFTLETEGGPSYIKPFTGVKWNHLELDENIRAVNAAGLGSTVHYDFESESSSEIRGVVGVLISGLWARNVSVRFEGSVGKDVYGATVGLEYIY